MDIYFPHVLLVDSLFKLGTATTGSEEILSAKHRVMRHTFTQGFLVTSAVPSLAAQSMSTAGSRQGNGWQAKMENPTSFSFHQEDWIQRMISVHWLTQKQRTATMMRLDCRETVTSGTAASRPRWVYNEDDEDTLHQTQSHPQQRHQKRVHHTLDVIQNLMDGGVVVVWRSTKSCPRCAN